MLYTYFIENPKRSITPLIYKYCAGGDIYVYVNDELGWSKTEGYVNDDAIFTCGMYKKCNKEELELELLYDPDTPTWWIKGVLQE